MLKFEGQTNEARGRELQRAVRDAAAWVDGAEEWIETLRLRQRSRPLRGTGLLQTVMGLLGRDEITRAEDNWARAVEALRDAQDAYDAWAVGRLH